MKIGYFDCFAGISGDMTLGALIDAGLNPDKLKSELSKLNVEGWDITTEKVMRNGIAGTKVHVITEEQKAHRHLSQIADIIDKSNLDENIKSKSKEVFGRLAQAEAKVHNTTPEKIHFHEVGALDAIIDIVGSVIGINLLGIEKIYASKIHLGSGFVDCEHGRIPLPAPATVELLKNVPTYSTGIEGELTTPTGATIITTLADSFGDMPPMVIKSSGYGAGSKEFEIPNMLRLLVGESSESGYETDLVTLIECNIDDMNPEFYEYVISQLITAGALDAWIQPLVMKKGRPGTLLSSLSNLQDKDKILDIIFDETTTLGVRIRQVERQKLRREIKTVKTKYGEIRVKFGYVKNRKTSVKPEYEDCRRLAEELKIPLHTIYDEAKKQA